MTDEKDDRQFQWLALIVLCLLFLTAPTPAVFIFAAISVWVIYRLLLKSDIFR